MTYVDLIQASQREVMGAFVNANVSLNRITSVSDGLLERAAVALLVASIALRGEVASEQECTISASALDWPAAHGRGFCSDVWLVEEVDGRYVASAPYRIERVSLQDFVVRDGDGDETTVPWTDVGHRVFFRESDATSRASRNNRYKDSAARGLAK